MELEQRREEITAALARGLKAVAAEKGYGDQPLSPEEIAEIKGKQGGVADVVLREQYRLTRRMLEEIKAGAAEVNRPGERSINQLVAESGLPSANVYRAIEGSAEPAFSTIVILAETLRVSLDDLLAKGGYQGPNVSRPKRKVKA